MPNRFQHQEIAQPPSTVLPQPEQSRSWFQGWTDPVRFAIAPAMAVALIASGAVIGQPPAKETVTEPRWHQPLSEPVRVAPRDAWYQDLTFNPLPLPAAPVVQQTAPTSPVDYGVVATVQFQYPTSASLVQVAPFAETVTESRWHQPWSEPVRVPPRDVWFQADTRSLNPVVSFSYYQPLTEPVRVAPRDVWFQPDTFGRAAPFPEEVSEDRWHQPWSEPVRVLPRDVWFQPDTLTRTQSDVTGIKYTPLSEPVRTAARDAWYEPDNFARAAPFPEEVSEDRWHQPWSEPVRTVARAAWYQDSASWNPSTPAAVISTAVAPVSAVDYGVFPEFRFQYQTLAIPTTTPTGETITVDKWFFSWQGPVLTLPRDVWFQADTFGRAAPFPEEVSEDRWHQPWSEPVRTAPRDAWFQFTAFAPNPVVSFSYYEPLSDPVRTALRDAWYQPDTLTRTASDVTGIQYPPLSEPVRAAPRDAWYQPDTRSLSTVFPEEVSEDRWHQPWSEPVRVAPRDAWYQDATSFWPFPLPNTATPPDSWFAPFSDPIRTALRDAWYQPDTLGRAAPFPEEVSEDRWHQPWSEPVRTAPRDAWFQADTRSLQPVVSFSYYQSLVDPVRTPARDAWFQDSAALTIVPTATIPWFTPLSDPVRTALRDAWYQDAVSWSTFTPAAVTVPSLTWFSLFADPIRVQPVRYTFRTLLVGIPNPFVPPDTGKVWPRYWIQDDPRHSINRDAPHDLVWAEEDEIAILIGLL